MKKTLTALALTTALTLAGCSKKEERFVREREIDGKTVTFLYDKKTGENSITVTRPDSTSFKYFLTNTPKGLILNGRQFQDTTIHNYDNTYPSYSKDSAECDYYIMILSTHIQPT